MYWSFKINTVVTSHTDLSSFPSLDETVPHCGLFTVAQYNKHKVDRNIPVPMSMHVVLLVHFALVSLCAYA
jgi:hypothetical protein